MIIIVIIMITVMGISKSATHKSFAAGLHNSESLKSKIINVNLQ